jgi:hypothetical protein
MEQAKALLQVSDHILNLLTQIILDCFIALADIAVQRGRGPMKLWQRMNRDIRTHFLRLRGLSPHQDLPAVAAT